LLRDERRSAFHRSFHSGGARTRRGGAGTGVVGQTLVTWSMASRRLRTWSEHCCRAVCRAFRSFLNSPCHCERKSSATLPVHCTLLTWASMALTRPSTV